MSSAPTAAAPRDWKRKASIMSARLARAFPSLPPGACARLGEEWERIEVSARNHAVRCCGCVPQEPDYRRNGDVITYVRFRIVNGRAVLEHDPEQQAKADARVTGRIRWWLSWVKYWAGSDVVVNFDRDPRGAVLKAQLPGEPEPC